MLFRISIVLLCFWLQPVQAQDAIELLAVDVRSAAEELREAQDDATRAQPAQDLMSAMKRFVQHKDILSSDVSVPVTSVRSPDGKIRMFSWNVPQDNGGNRYHGLMALKTRKRIDLTVFRDSTSVLTGKEERELYPGKWYGAIYYDLVQTKRGGKTYYTLLGWKGFSRSENQKVIEVLSLSGRRVKLGAPIFQDSEHAREISWRKLYRYGAQLKMNLSKNKEIDQILMDHLAPSRPDLVDQFAFYGPDLSYDAFTWDGRRWFFERDVDAKGNKNDSKLWNKPEKPRIGN